MTPPDAGWHTDPVDPGKERWWDGRHWTPTTRARQSREFSAPPIRDTPSPTPTITPHAAVTNDPAPRSARSGRRRVARWVAGGVLVGAVSAGVAVAAIASDESPSVGAVRGAGEPNPGVAPVVDPSPEVVAVDRVTRPGLGVPVRDGDLEFVVRGWDGTGASVTVTNIGDRPASMVMSSQYLIDVQQRRFEPDFDWRSDLAFADLNPGQSVSGTLRYVLSGATPSHLELHDSMFSDGVEVLLPGG